MAMVPASGDPSSPEDDLPLDVPPLEALEIAVDEDWLFMRNLGGKTRLGTQEVDEQVRSVATTLLAKLDDLPKDAREDARKDLEEILEHLDSLHPERHAYDSAESNLRSAHAVAQNASQDLQRPSGPNLEEIDNRLMALKKQKEELERLIAEVEAEKSEQVLAQRAAKRKRRSIFKESQGHLEEAKSARDNSWRALSSRAAKVGELGLRLYRYKTGPAQMP